MKLVKRLFWAFIVVIFSMNVVAFFHAYKFTHFADSSLEKTKKPEKLSTLQKVNTLLFGINNPRPVTKHTPTGYYQTIKLQSNRQIECWYIPEGGKSPIDTAKGTIVICHGFSGEKSSMLGKAAIFDSLNYNTFLIDFMGSGGSEGNTTTIGYKEAEQVKTAYEYLQHKGAKNIYIYGTSMGSVAIMKAIQDYQLKPKGIIIECPFGSMYKTVAARFTGMHVPPFPMAGFLVFWGGIQNNFWAFHHNPIEYARAITSPTLLLFGEKEETVSQEEINAIFSNLKGAKTLRTYKLAGHEDYLLKYKPEWTQDVATFLATIN